MLIKIAVIIFMVRTCAGKIKINITLTSNRASTLVKHTGYDDKLITEKEVNLFNVTEENLKWGFLKELGRVPDEVFLKDPTTNGDIFKQFKWRPIYRSIKITKINIVDIINENISIKVTKLFNKATEITKYTYSMFETVENIVNSTWSAQGMPNDDIVYDLNIKYGLTNTSFMRNWRVTKPTYLSFMFGIKSTGEIIMKPGDVMYKYLSGKRTVFLLNVTYSASLLGCVVGSYGEVYGHYHFWAPSIGNIMKAANLSNKIETTELIEIVWHTDPEVHVTNDVTKAVVLPYFPDKPYRAMDKKIKLRLKIPKKVKGKKCDCVSKPEDCKGKEFEDKCVPKPEDSKKKKYRVFPPKSQWRIVRT